MMYYFKSAGLGYAADGTMLPPEMSINPLIKAFNEVGYDAMTLGNHEFNFGKDVFGTLAQADFPMLQANIEDDDDDPYGLAGVPVDPYVEKTLGPEGVKVAILGIGNHRVPSYELPSNIAGLTFTDPIRAGKDYAPMLQASNDAVIALTHIGFTNDPKSVEVDNNVDTYFATQVSGVDAIIGGHSHTRPDTGFGDYKFLPTFVPGPTGAPVIVSQMYRYNTYLGQMSLGLVPDGAGGYRVLTTAGRYIPVVTGGTPTPEDEQVKALVQPYQDMINAYNNTVIGSTTVPIDTLEAFTEETNGANLQADASVWKLEHEGIEVDVHLSGAMTNRRIADTATPADPYELKVSDMFAAMPYENSLVVMEMNGPQLKQVLERAYRNYYYYEHVPGYGGYSYYTTCMLDTDAGNQIVYRDEYPAMPDGDNVAGLLIGGQAVDFTDAMTYYRVSSVNYLAAGACNFSDSGMTLWPLDQIVADTQYYVRDAVIEYIDDQPGPISPMVEGRLLFSVPAAPTVHTPVVMPEPSIVGQPVEVSATFERPDTLHGPATCSVDFGDGTMPVDGTVTGSTCTATYTYLTAGDFTVTVTVYDPLGQSGSASVPHDVPAAPTVSTPVVMPEPSYENQMVEVTAAFESEGAAYGPATCTVDFGDGSPAVPGTVTGMSCAASHTYAMYGLYTVTVTVTDPLGQSGSASTVHDVNFVFSGPYPPLEPMETNVAKAGSTVPVKFSLGGDKGMAIFATGYPTIAACSGGPATPVTGKLSYDPMTMTYNWVWKTPKTLSGCQVLTLGFVDGTTYTITFEFR
jgi:2',3'-cyclic-nucleotide 2'-phosphodiesterase (5'-nucleotidase family)/PKD repeat protein